MYQRANGSAGGGGGGCAHGEITVTAANQEENIDTGIVGIKRFVLLGRSSGYSNDDVYKMTACLWYEPQDSSDRSYFKWVPCGVSGGGVQAFSTQTTDVNKIQSVDASTGIVHVKFSGTPSTAVGTYWWFAE